MAKIARKLTDLVGNTPLMELSGYSGKYGLEQNIIAKLEAFNPAGSVKDRVALSMIEDAEARGTLKPGAYQLSLPAGYCSAQYGCHRLRQCRSNARDYGGKDRHNS